MLEAVGRDVADVVSGTLAPAAQAQPHASLTSSGAV